MSIPFMIQRGDRVTVISSQGYVHRTNVEYIFDDRGTFRWTLSWSYEGVSWIRDWHEVVAMRDEGVTWIRGWYKQESPEVAALKTAWSLVKYRVAWIS